MLLALQAVSGVEDGEDFGTAHLLLSVADNELRAAATHSVLEDDGRRRIRR